MCLEPPFWQTVTAVKSTFERRPIILPPPWSARMELSTVKTGKRRARSTLGIYGLGPATNHPKPSGE
jgi:hypothetical protein